jgi:hypothetical protein
MTTPPPPLNIAYLCCEFCDNPATDTTWQDGYGLDNTAPCCANCKTQELEETA